MPLQRFSYAPLTAGMHTVGITGDFSGWEIMDLEENAGIYNLFLDLAPGLYRYKLIVDGVWMADPANPDREPDPYGGFNSILEISESLPELAWDEIVALAKHKPAESYIKLVNYGAGEYELRFSWYIERAESIILHLDGQQISLERIGKTAIREVYHCMFSLLPGQMTIYYFSLKYGKDTLVFDRQGVRLSSDTPDCFQLTPDQLPVFQIPDWVRKGVIYQIFPDRFCNGDTSKNPNFSQWYYKDCKTPPPEGEYLRAEQEYFHFVENWYEIDGLKQSPWQPVGKPDWWSFYGGDIPGVQSKLDYLQDLGITIIYFNPLWQAKSNHKYDSADYHSIDPQFATTEEMQDFVARAHSKGIRIILDVAFNHTGETFWAFRDCVEKGSQSDYWNWYDWKKWPLPKPLPPDFKPKEYYQCWWGIKDMPDLNFDLSRPHPEENAIRNIKEARPNAALVDYLLSTVRWWLLEIGIDGFRLDVPDEVPFWFWELFRREVKEAKPDAWIVGEIWFDAINWISPRYFDSVMNYASFKNPVLDFFVHGLISKNQFREQIETGLALYPFRAVQSMMNLLGSHDTLRLYEVCKGDIARLKLAVVFQMCFLGSPHIYYGDEIAMGGGKDPDNRRPFNWRYAEDPSAESLREFYRRMIRLRKNHPAFSEGSFRFLVGVGDEISFERYLNPERIIVSINAKLQIAEMQVFHNDSLLSREILVSNS